MYKLVAVGGKLRGNEFKLQEGENIIGRGETCQVNLNAEGVSKNHLKITVNKESAFVEDMGSANGTIVNGRPIKKIGLKSGDKITLPNVILQLVYVREKKVIIKKMVLKAGEASTQDEDESLVPPMPDSPFGKISHIFQYKIMPIVYSFNKEYEWRSILAVLLTLYIVITIALTIFPVLFDSKTILLTEVAKRGYHYADDIDRLNASLIKRKKLEAIDTKFLDSESGIESYVLFDMQGRIIRPIGRMDEYIDDSFSVEAQKMAEEGREKFTKSLGDGEFGIAKTIKVYNPVLQQEEAVGVIAIKFAPGSLVQEAANNSKAYLESFSTSIMIGAIFFAIIYFMTLKHIEDLRLQIDLVLRNKQKEIVSSFLMLEMRPLRNSINSLLAKIKDAQGDGKAEFAEIEDDSKYLNILKQFMVGANGPVIIFNAEKVIKAINTEAEDVTGIRESSGLDVNILDVARDQGFAATMIDLCDQTANADGTTCKDTYELKGVAYEINIIALMGKDHFAKGFYATFVKNS